MKRAIALSVALLTVSTFAFAACGDDSSSSVSDDAAQLCSDVAALNSTVQGIAGQDIDLKTTSVTDVKDMIAEIQSQVEAISSSKSALSDQVKSDLQDAYDQFKSDLAAVKDASTLAGGRPADRDRADELPRRVGRDPVAAELLGNHHRLITTFGVP